MLNKSPSFPWNDNNKHLSSLVEFKEGDVVIDSSIDNYNYNSEHYKLTNGEWVFVTESEISNRIIVYGLTINYQVKTFDGLWVNHRKRGPSVISYADEGWYTDGKLHREDGPAINRFLNVNGVRTLKYSFFFLDGFRVEENEFRAKTTKLGKILYG
jgi:hypothetical protein